MLLRPTPTPKSDSTKRRYQSPTRSEITEDPKDRTPYSKYETHKLVNEHERGRGNPVIFFGLMLGFCWLLGLTAWNILGTATLPTVISETIEGSGATSECNLLVLSTHLPPYDPESVDPTCPPNSFGGFALEVCCDADDNGACNGAETSTTTTLCLPVPEEIKTNYTVYFSECY